METRAIIAGLCKYEIRRVIEVFGTRALLDREADDRPADAQFKAPEALALEIEDDLLGDDLALVGADVLAAHLLSRRQKFIAGPCWHTRLLRPGAARLRVGR
jgi:hypothetical protein